MKAIPILSAVSCLALTALILSGCAGMESQAQLSAQAKVTREQAQRTALAQVKHGTIKEAELERENGKLIWSFDIAHAGTADLTEVEIDALSGAVLETEVETEDDEA